MKRLAFVLFLACVAFCLQNGSAGYPFSKHLGKGVYLKWDYDDVDITLELTAPTLGWIGIGFSETGTMERADVILVTSTGGICRIWDAYAETNGSPDFDTSQDVEMLLCNENGTHTSATIRRKLKSSDEKDNDIVGGINNVIWAFGRVDKTELWRNTDYHRTNRGSHPMVLRRERNMRQTDSGEINGEEFIEDVQQEIDLAVVQVTESSDRMDLIYSASLDFENTVQLRWNYDDKKIVIQLIAPTRGWIGVGFSQTGSMAGADIILMGVSGQSSYVLDAHATQNGIPLIDASQDVEILSGSENNTHTIVTVARNRVTCDDDDKKIEEGTYRIIWAYGKKDLLPTGPVIEDYHARNRGSKSLKLLNPAQANDAKGRIDDENAKFFDLRPNNFTVPVEETYYYCKAFKFPETTKHHIIEYEPVYTPGNEKHIHHIVVYLCQRPVRQSILDTPGRCFEEIDNFVLGCMRIIVGWAIGMTKFTFPPDTGFSFGGSDEERYVIMQLHYDNPTLKEIVDSSGLRIRYTNKLRKYDVGLLTVQRDITTTWIPPNTEKFRVQGFCSRSCLRKGFRQIRGAKEVKVIGVILHSHLAGRSLRLRHFRNRAELEPLAKDDFYDFDYQEVQYRSNAVLKPTDSLVMQCDYGTIGKSRVTPGGLGTREEMCSAFLFYYPKFDLDLCDSSSALLETQYLGGLAASLNITITQEDIGNMWAQYTSDHNAVMKLVATFLDRAEWTPQKIKVAEEFTNNLPFHPICIQGEDWLLNYREELKIPDYKSHQVKDVCTEPGN